MANSESEEWARDDAQALIAEAYLETGGDCFHFRARLLQSHARFEPPPTKHHWMPSAVLPSHAPPHDRKPNIGFLRRSHRRRHDTNDGVELIVKTE